MATLTNNYNNCQLLNLGYAPGGRGPFIVRQEASVPGSMTFDREAFLLRKDGTWVLNLAVFVLPDKDKEQFFFGSTAEVMELLQGLVGDAKFEAGLPAGKSVAELKTAAQSTLTGLWGKIREAKP